jgi:thioester reductase-like protein
VELNALKAKTIAMIQWGLATLARRMPKLVTTVKHIFPNNALLNHLLDKTNLLRNQTMPIESIEQLSPKAKQIYLTLKTTITKAQRKLS